MNQPVSTWINPNQPKSTHINPNQPNSTWVNQNQSESTRINQNQPKSFWIIPNQPNQHISTRISCAAYTGSCLLLDAFYHVVLIGIGNSNCQLHRTTLKIFDNKDLDQPKEFLRLLALHCMQKLWWIVKWWLLPAASINHYRLPSQ